MSSYHPDKVEQTAPGVHNRKRRPGRIENKRGVNYYERFCEMALEDPSVMIALMKKGAPDLKAVEVEGFLGAQFGIIEAPANVPFGAPVGEDEKRGWYVLEKKLRFPHCLSK